MDITLFTQMQFDSCFAFSVHSDSRVLSFGLYYNIILPLTLQVQFLMFTLVALTFLTVMSPSCVSLSVEMSNISIPSPLMMVKSISVFFPMSLSVA